MTWESERIWVVGDEPPGRSQVKRAGDRIRRAAEAGEAPSPADLDLLDLFRSWNGQIHNTLQLRIGEVINAASHELPREAIAIAGRPLKTQAAIIAKLVREKSRLNRIQDIVGARVVVPDLDTQEAVIELLLRELAAWQPVLAKDTREGGDALGYRGVHLVVEIDGRYAEIQIRTTLQGLWAQVVEKLDEEAGTDLKHGSGPPQALQWLKAFSGRLERVEHGEKTDWATLLESALAILLVGREGPKP